MELKDLKQGDKLCFMFGRDFVTATVLENFPVQKRIRVTMKNPDIIQIFRYSDSNFDLWNILEPDKLIMEEVSDSSEKESSGSVGLVTLALAFLNVALER